MLLDFFAVEYTGHIRMTALKNSDRWVVYATFERNGRPTRHALAQLDHYRKLGFRSVVVDTSPIVDEARRESWNRFADAWLQRENVGHDFGSYRAGIDHLVRHRGVRMSAISLLLTNDSCFGPFSSLASILEQVDRHDGGPKVVGITDSFEMAYHLQSYWLYFPAPSATVLVEFMAGMAIAATRDEAIRDGELALSSFAQDRGYELCSVLDVRTLHTRLRGSTPWILSILQFAASIASKRYRYSRKGDATCVRCMLRRRDALLNFNPSIGFGVALVRSGLSPFLKRSLLRDNPYGDPSIARLGCDVDALSNEEVAALLDIPQLPLMFNLSGSLQAAGSKAEA